MSLLGVKLILPQSSVNSLSHGYFHWHNH